MGERLWAVGHLDEECEKIYRERWAPKVAPFGTFGACAVGRKNLGTQLTWVYSACAPWDLNPEPAD